MKVIDEDPELLEAIPKKRDRTKNKKTEVGKKRKDVREQEPQEFLIPQPPGSIKGYPLITSDPEAFFAYFRSLEPYYWPRGTEGQPHFRAYVYRAWPIIDHGIIGLKHNYIDRWEEWPFRKEDGSIDEDYASGMLRIHGSGAYRINIQDAKLGNVTMELRAWNEPALRNMVQFPPKLDLRTLVTADHRNKDYLGYLRSNNIRLPGEEEQESDMPQDPAVSAAVGKIMEHAVNTIVNRDDGSHSPIAPNTAMDAAAVQAVNLISKVATDTIQQVQAQHDPNASIAMIDRILGHVAPKGDNDMMRFMLDQQNALRTEQAKLREENQNLLTRLMETTKPKDLSQQLHELKVLKDFIEPTHASRTRLEPRREEDFFDKHGEKLMGLVSMALMAWMKMQQPAAPMAASAQPPVQQQQEEDVKTLYQAQMEQYLVPLIKTLIEGEGEDFADWVDAGYGEDVRKQIAMLGEPTLYDVVWTHPKAQDAYRKYGVDALKIQRFVHRFVNAEKYWASKEEEEEAPVEQMQPETGNVM